jgi:hypothetical protein
MNPNQIKNKFLDFLQPKAKATSGTLVNQPQAPIGPTKPAMQSTYNPNQNMSMVPPTPGATSPKPTVIKPPTTTSTTPKNTFINNLSTTQNSIPKFDAQGGFTSGGKYYAADSIQAKNSRGESSNTPTSPTAQTTSTVQENPYQKYLTTLTERTSNELLRTRKREDELRKNEIGQLERGQNYQLGEEERLSNRSLADLAIASKPTLDLYNKFESDKKTALENERYTAENAYKQSQDKIDNDLAQAKFEEDKRQFGQEYALAARKASEPKAMSAAQEAKALELAEKEVAAQQSASQSIGIVNNLLNGDRYKAISGGTQTGSIPFFGDRAAVNEYDQLQGLLKLGIRGLLKGQGAVSDYEGKVLGQAASSLSRLTSEGQMKEALQKVRGVLKTNNGQVTTVEVQNPETGERVTADLSGAEIYQLTNDGNIITYK